MGVDTVNLHRPTLALELPLPPPPLLAPAPLAPPPPTSLMLTPFRDRIFTFSRGTGPIFRTTSSSPIKDWSLVERGVPNKGHTQVL